MLRLNQLPPREPMTALRLLRSDMPAPAQPPAATPLDEPARAMLNQVRLLALGCRSAARADLFEACALLALDKDAAREAHATAFLQCLPQAIGQRPKWLRPGEAEVSFDEAWALRLIQAAGQGDHDSLAFLMRRRVAPWARRHVAYLAAQMSERFAQV